MLTNPENHLAVMTFARWGQMAIFWLFEVGMKYVWPGTYRRQSSSSPASNTQPNQGAGLHKFEATVGKVKNKMLPNPPLYGYQNDRLLMLIAAMYDKWGLSTI